MTQADVDRIENEKLLNKLRAEAAPAPKTAPAPVAEEPVAEAPVQEEEQTDTAESSKKKKSR